MTGRGDVDLHLTQDHNLDFSMTGAGDMAFSLNSPVSLNLAMTGAGDVELRVDQVMNLQLGMEGVGEADLMLTVYENDGQATVDVTGDEVDGETLTADFNDDDPDGAASDIEYQWIRGASTQIFGATSSTYVLQSADIGSTVKVRVRYTDAEGFEEEIFSAATGTIEAAMETETATLLAAMSTQPDSARITAIDTLIADLKGYGIWSKLDLLYVCAAHTDQAGRLNWKDPSNFTLTNTGTGTPTFTTDEGFVATSGNCLTTQWDRSNNASQLSQNSACIFTRVFNNSTTNATIFGASGASSNNRLTMSGKRTTNSAIFGQVNQDNASGINFGISGDNANVLIALDRAASGSNQTTVYVDGTSRTTAGGTSSSMNSVDVYLCGTNENGTISNNTVQKVSVAGLGAHLTSTEHANLKTAIEAYMAAL